MAEKDGAVCAQEAPLPPPLPSLPPAPRLNETPGEAQLADFSFSPLFFAVVIEDDRIDDVLKNMTDKAPPGV